MKKAICIIISLVLIISICGCRQNPTENSSGKNTSTTPISQSASAEISLLYSQADSFNPYTAKTTMNREISSLLYDSLIKTDNSFEPVLILAASTKCEDKRHTIKIKDAHFTDGSAVTADDIIYSYNIAKDNALYSHNFYEVVSLTAENSKTVVFTLSQNDPYFTNLLNFPIVKSGTSGVYDSDGKEIAPIGCGRYKISQDGACFEINENYYGAKGEIKTIKLINSPDTTSTSHYVEVGAVGMYYAGSDHIVRMSAKKADVNLNRFIYIGINDSYGSLATREMRYAISSALDRDAICQTAYYNNAVSATGFFNPYFKDTKSLQTIENKPNSKITVENLSKIGYNNMNSNGFYANSAGNNPVFTLLVNSENSSRVAAANLVVAQCKAAGIQINVVTCTYEQYLERLSTGSFQLYLGEVQLLDNMDMTQLVVSGGAAAYGVSAQTETAQQSEGTQIATVSSPCKTILDSYHLGQCGIGDVAGTLLTEMPQIPVCFLKGILFYDSDIKGAVEPSGSDIYLNFENYEF